MLTKVIKKRVRNRRRRSEAKSDEHEVTAKRTSGTLCSYSRSVNLYRFIQLILGPDTTDTNIARRWRMDTKNFSQFKSGKTPVPRLEKLTELARVLKINKHLVFQVALGASADKVFNLIKKNDLSGQIKLLFP